MFELVILQGGVEVIALRGTREECVALYGAKKRSHSEAGWAIGLGEDGGMDLVKCYENGRIKERRIFIREARQEAQASAEA